VAAQDVVQRDRNAARQNLPSIFTVRVLGFGNDPVDGGQVAPSSSSSPALQSRTGQHYDPANLVQVVGLGGNFDPKLLARMTESERRQLQQDH
jgi:hypothetical protein